MAFNADKLPQMDLCAECGCPSDMFSEVPFPDDCATHREMISDILEILGPEEEPPMCEAYCCEAAPKKELKAKPKVPKQKKVPKKEPKPQSKPKKSALTVSPSGGNKLKFSVAPAFFLAL
jgi:hypothetical protein